jgi:hypothetical protein
MRMRRFSFLGRADRSARHGLHLEWRMQRSAVITIPVTMALFFGGGAGGVGLASAVAPNSIIASFLGLLSLPFAFIAGMHLWLGMAILTLLVQLPKRLLSQTATQDSQRGKHEFIPPGSVAFAFTSLVTCSVSGLVIAAVATRLGFISTWALYVAVGVVYGTTCWILARTGFLPFPEDG